MISPIKKLYRNYLHLKLPIENTIVYSFDLEIEMAELYIAMIGFGRYGSNQDDKTEIYQKNIDFCRLIKHYYEQEKYERLP